MTCEREALQARQEGLDERERLLRAEEAACGRLKAELLREQARLQPHGQHLLEGEAQRLDLDYSLTTLREMDATARFAESLRRREETITLRELRVEDRERQAQQVRRRVAWEEGIALGLVVLLLVFVAWMTWPYLPGVRR